MVKAKNAGKKGKGEESVKEEEGEWEEVFADLHKVAVKLGQVVKV